MRRNNEKLKVVTLIVLAILLLTGVLVKQCSYKYQWTWVLIPWVRIIFHAVAATTLSMGLSWIGLLWTYVNHNLMGDWITIVYLFIGIRKKKLLRKLRKANTIFFRYTQPFIGAAMYIIYSYGWEKRQQISYPEAIQIGILIIDIMFAIMGSIIWMYVFRSEMVTKYGSSSQECIDDLRDDVEKILKNNKLSSKQKKIVLDLIIVVILLIPLWVLISAGLFLWLFSYLIH